MFYETFHETGNLHTFVEVHKHIHSHEQVLLCPVTGF